MAATPGEAGAGAAPGRPLRLLADEGIPCADAAFAALGHTTLVPGRSLTARALRECDALFVRSVTRVDAELLHGTKVRFVGTATIGTDHVDLDYLRNAGIGFASAAGSNANSVAEYVVCALLCLARRRGLRLAGRSLGVVGVGNVGGRVAGYARALGMDVLQNDPPRARAEGGSEFRELAEVMRADCLTLHVPLTRTGTDATHHLLDAWRLAELRPSTLLVNTARGAVVDNAALLAALRARALGGAVLDVWEGEPNPDPELIEAVDLATPHVAGYSLDGKLAGTELIAHAACRYFGVQQVWSAASALPSPAVQEIALEPGASVEDAAWAAARACYDIERDDAAMRVISGLSDSDRARAFDRLRRDYPARREFLATRVASGNVEAREVLARLGFGAAPAPD